MDSLLVIEYGLRVSFPLLVVIYHRFSCFWEIILPPPRKGDEWSKPFTALTWSYCCAGQFFYFKSFLFFFPAEVWEVPKPCFWSLLSATDWFQMEVGGLPVCLSIVVYTMSELAITNWAYNQYEWPTVQKTSTDIVWSFKTTLVMTGDPCKLMPVHMLVKKLNLKEKWIIFLGKFLQWNLISHEKLISHILIMSATHSTEANNKLSQVKGYAKKFYGRLRKKLWKSNRFYVEKWKEQHVC